MAVLVDTLAACQAAAAQLLQEREVAVDLEGIRLSRQGPLCLMQMCGSSSESPTVYLFDVVVLGRQAFAEGGLKELLESEEVTKIFYDVRGDNDALFYQFGVRVRSAYDIQVLWHVLFQHPDEPYLQGLKKVQGAYLEESQVLTAEEMARVDAVKLAGLRLFAPDHGGRSEVWQERPLDGTLVEYAAADIKFLIDMRVRFTGRARQAGDDAKAQALEDAVRAITADRLERFLALPDGVAVDQERKKFRDFDLPSGFNDDVSAKVELASTRERGRLIGRKGTTIQGIRTACGVRVLLRDGVDHAVVVGPPRSVQAAVERIGQIIA